MVAINTCNCSCLVKCTRDVWWHGATEVEVSGFAAEVQGELRDQQNLATNIPHAGFPRSAIFTIEDFDYTSVQKSSQRLHYELNINTARLFTSQ
jgi:hypothetical protein